MKLFEPIESARVSPASQGRASTAGTRQRHEQKRQGFSH